MVLDAAEPRVYDIRAVCMTCGQARSKKVLAKPENEAAEEMAFLLRSLPPMSTKTWKSGLGRR